MTKRPHGTAGEGVILRDCSIEPKAENFAIRALEILRAGGDVRIAGCHQQCPIRQNEQAAAIVDRCPRNAIEQDAHVAERRAVVGKAHDPFENLRSFPPGVCNEHMRRIGKIWVERHTEQAALALLVHVREHCKRPLLAGFGVDATDPPWAFGDPEPTIRPPENLPRRIQIRGNGAHSKLLRLYSHTCNRGKNDPSQHRTPHQRYNNPATATEQQRPHYQQRLPHQVRRSLPGKSDASFGCRCDCTSRGVDLSAIQCHVASSDRASAGRSASTMCERRCACAGRVGEIQNAWLVLKT
ncbi:hypothetical protein HRbin20_01484 [bacterium HR20]|nr:hypothetical protein HRbin20_01484 [bacterium HR20]